ncbi:gp53-like domain-containing protein [Morganella morganii]|uniref:gp53-like domain-containing protein n=1 Tax=Morganella morganii TaxID=582 RepID=UPI000F8425C3|nr:hypothetical protein [Morganella morganii]RTY22129.1 hypothetical protein EKS23_08730 [Morganella morganii subsp. morganii]
MTAIVSPHVCCNDGIITDLSGYGCIPRNLGLPELLDKKFNKTGGKITGNIVLNDGTATQDVSLRGWGQSSRETAFEVNIGSGYALNISKYQDGSVIAAFKGTVTPEDYSNFDARYAGRAAFESIMNTALKSENGWFRDGATGLIIQWGVSGAASSTGQATAMFPIPFPNGVLSIMVSEQSNSADSVIKWGVGLSTKTSTTLWAQAAGGTSPSSGERARFLVIGG